VLRSVGGQLATGERRLTARYALEEVLARGGMGEVWRARDLRLGRPVAVKVLHGAQADPNFRTRFRAEAQHAARLSHPNIAAVFDYGEETAEPGDEPTPFLVMELVEGESLADLLARRGRLGVGRTLSILRQLSSALAAAHEAGVVHRDVKPANVLVRPDGIVKITDFGIAASAASAALTETGQVLGTARYLSPEQARGKRGTPASDVYALGLVGYECLAGHPAFDGPDPVEVAAKQVADQPPPLPPDVPEQVRGLVRTAMAKDPAHRLPDGAALRDALDRVLDSGRRAARSAVPPRHGAFSAVADDEEPLEATAAGASALLPLTADEGLTGRRRRWWPFAAAGALLCVLVAALVVVGLSGAAGSAGPVRARVGAGGPATPAGSGSPAPAGAVTPDVAVLPGAASAGTADAGGAAPAAPTGSGPDSATAVRGTSRGAGAGTAGTGTRALASTGTTGTTGTTAGVPASSATAADRSATGSGSTGATSTGSGSTGATSTGSSSTGSSSTGSPSTGSTSTGSSSTGSSPTDTSPTGSSSTGSSSTSSGPTGSPSSGGSTAGGSTSSQPTGSGSTSGPTSSGGSSSGRSGGGASGSPAPSTRTWGGSADPGTTGSGDASGSGTGG
jgi:eukaryotic-like serine/threonine-protein kinase